MERTAKPVKLENEGHFNESLCIESTLKDITPDLYSLGDRVYLEQKFLPEEVVARNVNGEFQLAGINKGFDQTKADFNAIETRDYDSEISGFGIRIWEKSKELSLDEDRHLNELELVVDERAFRDISDSVKFSSGQIVTNGWQVYPSRLGEAVLVAKRKDNNPYLPDFMVVNLDALYEKDPEFLKDEIRKIYSAQLGNKVQNSVSYHLAEHRVNQSELVPNFINALSEASDREKEDIQRLVELTIKFDKDGVRRIGNVITKLKMAQIQIPNENRFVRLDSTLSHVANCLSEPRQVRSEASKKLNVLAEIALLSSTRPDEVEIDLQGHEILQNTAKYIPEHIEDALRIESNSLVKDQEVLQLVDSTSGPKKGIDITNKTLKRRAPKMHRLIDDFKRDLGESYLQRPNFEEFMRSMVSKLGLELGSALQGYGIKSLADAEKVVGQSLYINTTSMKNKDKWIMTESRFAQKPPEIMIKDERLKDTLLYIAVKNVQQNTSIASVRNGADQVAKWLAEKYSRKIESTSNRINEHKRKDNYFRTTIRKLNISKDHIARIVKSVKTEKMGKFQSYDYSKLDMLYQLLVYSKQGLVNLESQAVKAFVVAIYPNLTENDLNLLK